MNEFKWSLNPVEKVEILTVIDNYVDVLLGSTAVVERPPLAEGGNIPTDTLVAEHGLSLLVSTFKGNEKHTILFDTGYSSIGVPHNLEKLGVDLGEIEAIIISHGHMDHNGALEYLLGRIPKTIPVVIHPGAFHHPRFLKLEDGKRLTFPRSLARTNLQEEGIELRESQAPSFIANDTVMISGEVERTTEFEKGLPNALLERDGRLEKDPIIDDQAIFMNVHEKGLVIISGCSHAGIINTIRYARKTTGLEGIHAVIGGFHLSGPAFEPIIDQTIKELKDVEPALVVPMHCTGWKAVQRFSEVFPDSFVLNSVGSRITLSN